MEYLRKSLMSFYALGFFAFIFVSTAQASVTEVQKLHCDMISHSAEMIMEFRQYNKPMRETMRLGTSDLTKAMIEEAYSMRRYSSFEMQQDAIKDFGNKYYLECYNAAKAAEGDNS